MKRVVAFAVFAAVLASGRAGEAGVASLTPSPRQLRRVLFDCETSHNYVY